ncbi:hypothetical protein BJ912DRAFT_932853 [Pholiota molesta]|nr:hypothetical protein BJ912DRAFT_932849 [Pholiota molesta]KAF8171322.1 hypothetical protein BJ912DRAFT_932853 [Pholiota molesta]
MSHSRHPSASLSPACDSDLITCIFYSCIYLQCILNHYTYHKPSAFAIASKISQTHPQCNPHRTRSERTSHQSRPYRRSPRLRCFFECAGETGASQGAVGWHGVPAVDIYSSASEILEIVCDIIKNCNRNARFMLGTLQRAAHNPPPTWWCMRTARTIFAAT